MRGKNHIILRARTLLPVARPPIDNGAVLVSGNRIRAVGRWADLPRPAPGKTCDLGDAILLPGLVNAHCHLDYTGMAGMLAPPRTFTDWIHLMISAKAQWEYADYARSWRSGARQLLETGTTSVGDIETVPDLLPEAWNSTPLRVVSFLEMTGIRASREPEGILREALAKIGGLDHPRCQASLSPHAPYSTTPGLLRQSAEVARKRGWRLCVHVAESEQEFEMFRHARGPMYAWLKRNDREMSDCGQGSPVQHLARNRVLGGNLLAVHANVLARGDAALLGRHHAHVVHCPRSHEYFRHPPFPRHRLVQAGVNVCLGTDSLATVRKVRKQNPELDLFEEMRALADSDPGLSAAGILRMATVNGARALGFAGQIGELTVNALADMIVIPARAGTAEACAAVLAHSGPVSAVMIGGKWAVPPK
ncbi:MAG TPA: amidohydrolase family protein [Candidatus Acidoferrum sp.]|nr:amidohydrolase family protein [Candidatus Acidoferrum sp.]